MSQRPKREAAKKSQQKLKELDKELDLSDVEESDGDFSSASSDDFDPKNFKSKNKAAEDSESEAEPSAGSGEDEEEDSFVSDIKQKSRKSNSNKSIVATLRKTAIKKFSNKQRPDSKICSSSQKLLKILKKAEFKKSKPNCIICESEDDDDDETPDYDCSGGLRLSDSENSDSDQDVSSKTKAKHAKEHTIETMDDESSGNSLALVDLKAIHDNLQIMKSVKEKLSNYEGSKSKSVHKENVNIADLLAMGEESKTSHGKKKKVASQKRKKASQMDDSEESDSWEDVEDNNLSNHHAPKDGVEIFLNDFGEQNANKVVKPVDVEAQMMRKINRKRKEHQNMLHSVELTCWIAHYAFVNKRLNDTDLMNEALKLLPKNSKQCYPKDKTDIDYFTQITKWFKSTIKLNNTKMYCDRLKKRPPLMMSLAIQMRFKVAICRRDYILIYIILLRALGIQCRMVQSVICDPKICPKSELFSLSTKKPDEKADTSKSSSKSKKSSSDSKKMATKSEDSSPKQLEKIPQLDGGNDLPDDRKKSRKPMKLKGSTAYQVDESYIDIKKDGIKPVTRTRSMRERENFSPKIQIQINSPNHVVRKSASEKYLPNSQSSSNGLKTSLSETNFSPRTTRSKSKEQQLPSVKEDEKKDTLKAFSPRRLRSRSGSNDVKPSTSKKSSTTTKPSLKVLSQKSSKVETVKKMETLEATSSPIARRLRSRSRSTDNRPADAPKLSNLSRKRESKSNTQVDEKKLKLSVAPKNNRKRAAQKSTKEEVVSKKSKKTPEEKQKEEPVDESDDSSLKYFKAKSIQKKSTPKAENKSSSKASTSTSKAVDRRILSSDTECDANAVTESPSKKSKGIDIWVEVYSENDEKWIAVDVHRGKIDCAKEICNFTTKPMVYVFAWNNDNSVKDVSARYCKDLNTTTRKMRVERDYLSSMLNVFHGSRTGRDLKEDNELNLLQLAVPLPKSIAEFKNHPLYALKRHLLKFQAIYPPEPPILGYIREEAVYPRDCVFTLHSRESWVKEARVVKLHEKAYKMVTTMKWDRAKNKVIRDIPLEIFGIWQTQDYDPPTAENGLVPRNGYGNVELFKPQMLPHGTVHLQLPGLNKVCKKLNIDCAQAVVGFDSHGGFSHAVFDGYVVCKEFEEKVIDGWNREQEEIEKKEREKTDKRVFGNWRKLIKGLLIRERLKRKYDFNNEQQ